MRIDDLFSHFSSNGTCRVKDKYAYVEKSKYGNGEETYRHVVDATKIPEDLDFSKEDLQIDYLMTKFGGTIRIGFTNYYHSFGNILILNYKDCKNESLKQRIEDLYSQLYYKTFGSFDDETMLKILLKGGNE